MHQNTSHCIYPYRAIVHIISRDGCTIQTYNIHTFVQCCTVYVGSVGSGLPQLNTRRGWVCNLDSLSYEAQQAYGRANLAALHTALSPAPPLELALKQQIADILS